MRIGAFELVAITILAVPARIEWRNRECAKTMNRRKNKIKLNRFIYANNI